MTDFDAAGGPWGYRLRPAAGRLGFDVSIEAGTFSNQPAPVLQGTIADQTVYAGGMADGETFLSRHNWFNQGAHYRAVTANYPDYPRVTVLDYHNLQALGAVLPDVAVTAGGSADLVALFPLLANAAVVGSPSLRLKLLALLSGCAATLPQRATLATALALDAGAETILTDHGVLLEAYAGTFTSDDHAVIHSTLALLPEPVKDALQLIVLDESLGAAGGYGSGGIITLSLHAGGPGGFAPYPSGSQLPTVKDRLQSLLVHEVGHMCDAASVGLESSRWEAIYAAGATDPDAFLYGTVFPVPSEDIIFYFLGYCTDSATIVAEVAARGNGVLSQKLAHAIDLLPCVVRDHVPFFTTSPATGVTNTSLAPVTRGPSLVLGDDGMITSVDGVVL